MHLYDKEGMPISLTTMNKVYAGATKGKIVKLYARTFKEFYSTLSDKEIANLWKLAITSLGWDKYPEYQTLTPFNFKFFT